MCACSALREALAADGMCEEAIDATLVPVDDLRRLEEAAAVEERDPLKLPSEHVPERVSNVGNPAALRALATLPPYGQLVYRSDPVARHHLYAREWAKHPAPGEKKRHALRWKVREYMLRHDCLM